MLRHRLVPPLAVFVCFYLAVLYAGMRLAMPNLQWVALAGAVIATAATIAICEDGRWNLGLFVPLPRAALDCLGGLAFSACLIGTADLLIILSTDLRHVRGGGFPWREILLVFIPAVFHEELLFRGYPFQKLWLWRRRTAIVIVSLIFAGLHLGNNAVSVAGMINVFLGGVILSLAYERNQRLWFPIGLHLGWNLISGPILGYGVSGYAAEATMLRTIGTGPAWLTGGGFGIEGSLWMTVTEVVAVVLLARSKPK